MPGEGNLFDFWFEPRRLFAGGAYPARITTALRIFPQIEEAIRGMVAEIAPRRALEVGPGDRPVIEGVARAVYLDLVAGFLKDRAGGRVIGDLRLAPFRTAAFDLAVANDVLTHIPPGERPLALRELARLAPQILIFNPEAGTPEVRCSPVSVGEILRPLHEAGRACRLREFVARTPRGAYRMTVIAARPG
jgi:hypothetical protein